LPKRGIGAKSDEMRAAAHIRAGADNRSVPRARALSVVLLVAILAACGTKGTTYAIAKTRSCLAAHGASIGAPAGDVVASTATGGAFRASLVGNSVTLAFGTTVADANSIDAAYRRFAGKNVGIDQVLFQQGNAVMLWHLAPQGDDAGVLACLKS
jgi:hypothetical protein